MFDVKANDADFHALANVVKYKEKKILELLMDGLSWVNILPKIE